MTQTARTFKQNAGRKHIPTAEVVTVDGERLLRLRRGKNQQHEDMTVSEAHSLLEAEWMAVMDTDCDGTCWLCVLDECLSIFR